MKTDIWNECLSCGRTFKGEKDETCTCGATYFRLNQWKIRALCKCGLTIIGNINKAYSCTCGRVLYFVKSSKQWVIQSQNGVWPESNDPIKIKGNYGTCYICDNMHPKFGLTTWPANYFQLSLTDPPYNIDAKKPGGVHKNTKVEQRPEIRIYNDKKDKEVYFKWCNSWFTALKQISKSGAIFTGYTNLGYWLWNHNLEYWIWYKRNSGTRAYNAFFNAQEPIVTFGKMPRKVKHDIFDIYVNNGFLNKSREKWIHPHPKPLRLIKLILEQARIDGIVIDPFAGSGTVIEICEEMGIHWVAYEINPQFIPDIEKRIQRGIVFHQNYQKTNATNLGGFLNG